MSDQNLLAGPAIRRLRRREGLTQSAMATALGISPSYLNLIERNQRALTARVLVQLAQLYDFDPRSLKPDDTLGGIDGLRRRLSDPRFADLAIDRDEIAEWLAAAPHAAQAFARLFDAAAGAGEGQPAANDPLTLTRHEIERWRNHFADLDHAAEELADELRLSHADIGTALADRLRQKHQLAIRILPVDVMPDTLRRLDLHARQLQLSEMLDTPSRHMQMAVQLGLLEQREDIAAIANGAQFADRAAWRLFRRHLASYFAAALLMPYGRFLRACETTGYDLALLQRRFGVSFEHLAHRLTTLHRVGQRGLPFFMARVDASGQFSKRYTGASGTRLLETERTCPLWAIHHPTPTLTAQSLDLADQGHAPTQWLSFSQAVSPRFTIALGLESAHAGALTPTQIPSGAPTPIGLGCALCPRKDCRQRARPPRGTTLQFNERERSLTPFDFNP
jgi:predicted transcriptional regulator/DNA-binding XRE family transcriptional regulator